MCVCVCVCVCLCICMYLCMYIRIFMSQQPLVSQGLLIIEASLSHSDTPHSVGLLWTRDRPVAETST